MNVLLPMRAARYWSSAAGQNGHQAPSAYFGLRLKSDISLISAADPGYVETRSPAIDSLRDLRGMDDTLHYRDGSPHEQISLTDLDRRSMATSGRGSGVVGYNVQVAVDTENHLIVTHEVTTTGSDRSQLARVAKNAKAVLQMETLEAVADRGYYHSEEILAYEQAGIAVTLPPASSAASAGGEKLRIMRRRSRRTR